MGLGFAPGRVKVLETLLVAMSRVLETGLGPEWGSAGLWLGARNGSKFCAAFGPEGRAGQRTQRCSLQSLLKDMDVYAEPKPPRKHKNHT